jgi:Flp pilus assembly protein TadG
MMTSLATRKIRRRLRRFIRDRKGIAAVEFAAILPAMLSLYVGAAELGDGFTVQFKSALVARTITDLASQYVSINNSTMSTILNASSQVISPYSAANMVVTLSEITTDANGHATVTWSDSLHGSPRTVGSSVTLPSNLQTANITILLGEVTYPYTPPVGYVFTGTINIKENQFFYPRLSDTISRVNS